MYWLSVGMSFSSSVACVVSMIALSYRQYWLAENMLLYAILFSVQSNGAKLSVIREELSKSQCVAEKTKDENGVDS